MTDHPIPHPIPEGTVFRCRQCSKSCAGPDAPRWDDRCFGRMVLSDEDARHAWECIVTPITYNEHGDEVHESWITVRANKTQSTGTRLFDSEIDHREFITLTIERVNRKRDINRDWLHNYDRLAEIEMSMSQWGAFVSSFGDGSGVPATLGFMGNWDFTPWGRVPSMPFESRLAESHAEVRGAATKATEKITEVAEAVREAFDRKAGRREMGELLRNLEIHLDNVPGNMEYAAKSLAEHTENVVTKAKADIEGMVINQARQLGIDPTQVLGSEPNMAPPELESGEPA